MSDDGLTRDINHSTMHIRTSTFRALALLLLGVLLDVLMIGSLLSVHALAESGAEPYKMKCAPCHGATGAGETMLGKNMNLRALGSPKVQEESDEELFTIISKGKNKMPGYDRKLSRDQIAAVVRYIRSLKK